MGANTLKFSVSATLLEKCLCMETRRLQLSFRVCPFAQGFYCCDLEWDLGRLRLSLCEEAGVSEPFRQCIGSPPLVVVYPMHGCTLFFFSLIRIFTLFFLPSMIFENQVFPSCFMETLFCFTAKRRGSLKKTPMLVSKLSGESKKYMIKRIACYWGLCLAKERRTVGVQKRADSLNLQQEVSGPNGLVQGCGLQVPLITFFCLMLLYFSYYYCCLFIIIFIFLSFSFVHI